MTRLGEGKRDVVSWDFDYRAFHIGKLGELSTRRALNFLAGHLGGKLDVL